MATAVENLNKYLQLAVRQLKIISGTVNEIPDSIFELVDQIYDLLLSLTEPGFGADPSVSRGGSCVGSGMNRPY